MRKLSLQGAVILFCLAIYSRSNATLNWIENLYLGLNAESSTYAFDMGTSYFYSPSDTTMLYQYTGTGVAPVGTSIIVVRIDGEPNTYSGYSVQEGGIIQDLSKGTYFIQGKRRFRKQVSPGVYNDLLDLTTRWEFVNNPATGVHDDTCMFKFVFSNPTLTTHYVALRLELDTMIVAKDGANISINNGVSVVNDGTVWYKSLGQIPSNWWDYDVDPNLGTPSLVGRGYIKDNAYGLPATEPDIMEVNYWYNVNGLTQWTLAPVATPIGSDSAVVLWWVNGASPTSAGYQIDPGQSLTFVTYYGINQEKLLTTPTVTPTYTATPTVTDTWTSSATPTMTRTYTMSPTPTFTKTMTTSPTWTITKTQTDTPTDTITPTISPTWTVSQTFTISPTMSVTPTITETSTITQTWSVTETYTITPTLTQTLTITLTPTLTMTVTITPTPLDLVLDLKGNFPNPFFSDTHIVYWLSVDADVEIKVFTVSGEIVRRDTGIKGKAGYNDFFWNGANNSGKPVASGIFIYRVYAATSRQKAVSDFSKAACVK